MKEQVIEYNGRVIGSIHCTGTYNGNPNEPILVGECEGSYAGEYDGAINVTTGWDGSVSEGNILAGIILAKYIKDH